MNAIEPPQVFFRSMATRGSSEVPEALDDAIAACRAAGFDLVIVETPGIGQGDAGIVEHCDLSLYVMTPGVRRGQPAREDRHARLRRRGGDQQVRAPRRRGRPARRAPPARPATASCSAPIPSRCPVFGTIASRFNDDGVTALYQHLRAELAGRGLARRRGPAARAWRARPARRSRRSCRPTAPATWPRSPSAVRGPPRHHRRAGAARPGSCSSCSPPATCSPTAGHATDDLDAALGGRACAPSTTRPATCSTAGRPSRPSSARRARAGVAVRQRRAAGGAPPLRGRRRAAPLPAVGERAGAVPVHRRGVPAQAGGRGPGPHVRGRGRRLPHQPALPPAQRGAARHPPVHRLRLGHPLRLRPRRAARHLRQGRQLRRVDRHARRHGGALRRVRPDRPVDVGVDDDQRARPHDPRHVPQHGHRPAPRARAGRGAAPRCGAPCRPTSSRRTRARTPASSPPSSRSG